MLGQKNVACPSLHALREIGALSGVEVDGGVGVTFKQNICLAHSLNDGKECQCVQVCLHSDVSKREEFNGTPYIYYHILCLLLCSNSRVCVCVCVRVYFSVCFLLLGKKYCQCVQLSMCVCILMSLSEGFNGTPYIYYHILCLSVF